MARPTLPTTYYVWRRNSPNRPHLDGYVSATTYDPGKNPRKDDETFDILLVTEDWSEAKKVIETERGDDTRYGD